MQKPTVTTYDNQLIELDSVDSTNNYAMARIRDSVAGDGMLIVAGYQTSGKGQRDKTWESPAGLNLMMSLIVEPRGLPLARQFLFSAAVTLGMLETVKAFEKNNWSVKWPNDIYWNDRKAAGLLIESVIKGENWSHAVVGIGMNINQESFPDSVPNAVSLKQVTGLNYNPVTIAKDLVPAIKKFIDVLRKTPDQILELFNDCLFKKNEVIGLKKGKEIIVTRLKGVDARGYLITEAGSFSHEEAQIFIR
jgi:BirA family transcriptional regulator, biotin operon repressor / biotin---[acetyl-CoA-carboxylase] ligase